MAPDALEGAQFERWRSLVESLPGWRRVGDLAVELGLVGAADVDRALSVQRSLRATGTDAVLLDVMVQCGILTSDQARDVLIWQITHCFLPGLAQALEREQAATRRLEQTIAELRQMQRDLLALHDVAASATSARDPRQAFDLVGQALAQVLGAVQCLALVWDPAQRRLTHEVGMGQLTDQSGRLPLCEQPFSIDTLFHAETRLVPDVARQVEHPQPFLARRMAALVARSMRVEDRLCGVLLVGFPSPRPLGERESRLVEVASALCAGLLYRS